MNSLQKYFSPNALGDAYARNRSRFRSASSAGIDGVCLAAFDDDLTENFRDISARVLSGKYKHKPLKVFSIEKSPGKIRWICVPTIRDRLVQRQLVEIFLENSDRLRTGSGFGALKRTGADAELTAVDAALKLRQSNRWVVKSDISAFFDEIPRDHVKAAYRKVNRKRSLYHLIDSVIDVEAAASATLKKKMQASGIVWGRGLRQGMPLSPILAHISLIELDIALSHAGFKHVRYVDDLAFFGATKDDAIKAFLFAQDWLSKRTLMLSDIGSGKTELRSPAKHLEFLGIDIYKPKSDYRLRIPKKKFASLDGRFSPKRRYKPR